MNIFLLLFFSVFFGNAETTETIDLQIVITNIHIFKGNVEIGIFNNPKTFLQKGKEYKSLSKKVTNDSLVFTLKGVPKGNYAVSVYHDKNADKQCNLNFFGIPIEPYGFSKNFKPKLSKPEFEDCKINAQHNQSIVIKLLD